MAIDVITREIAIYLTLLKPYTENSSNRLVWERGNIMIPNQRVTIPHPSDAGVELRFDIIGPIIVEMELNLSLPRSRIDSILVVPQRLKRIRREVHRLKADAVLMQQTREVVNLRPDIMVLVLQEENMSAGGRQLHIDSSHALKSTVAETIA